MKVTDISLTRQDFMSRKAVSGPHTEHLRLTDLLNSGTDGDKPVIQKQRSNDHTGCYTPFLALATRKVLLSRDRKGAIEPLMLAPSLRNYLICDAKTIRAP